MNKGKIILLLIGAILILGGSGVYYNCFLTEPKTVEAEEKDSTEEKAEEKDASEIKEEENVENKEEEKVEAVPNTKSISEVLAETKKLQSMNNTKILYFSEDKVIVNTDVSLLIFDFKTQSIARALDLSDFRRTNNLSYGGTSFKVSKDGMEVYIISGNEDKGDIYCYDIKNDNTRKIESLSEKEIYDGSCKSGEVDYSKDDYINNTTGAFRNKKLIDHKHLENGNVGYIFYDERLNPDSNNFDMFVLIIDTKTKKLETYGIEYK